MQYIVSSQAVDNGTVRGLITTLRGRYSFLDAMPIGQSVQKREISGIILGGGRERILYAAGFSGQDQLHTLVLLRFCEDLCKALERGESIANIKISEALAGRSLVFVPQVNPDGAEISVHGSGAAGENARMVRELGGNTPGAWHANARGVDINYNFNAGWQELQRKLNKCGICSPSAKNWSGQAPESEPETAALIGLCERAKFRHLIALNSQGKKVYWKYGDKTPTCSRVMAEVMAAASKYSMANHKESPEHGGFMQWFIEHTGRPGFTFGLESLSLEHFEDIYQKVQEMLLLGALM